VETGSAAWHRVDPKALIEMAIAIEPEDVFGPFDLYGQSFGGAAVVKLARQLDKLGVPVLLTVQIDSVGRGDARIPPNVARAASLFQRNGVLISGEAPIVAEDL
jgi:thioesterase domain-containing protein